MTQPRKPLIDRLASALQMLAGLVILVTAAGVTLNALARFAFSRDLSLISELGGFVFLVVIFLGLAATFLSGSHVSVELLSLVVPERFSRWFETTVVPVLCFIFVTALLVTSTMMTLRYFHSGRVTIGHYPLPYWAIIAVVPIGTLMLDLVLIRLIILRLRGR
ncbi:TRAP transporter small permease subunit [Pararhodobacter zhoushanensis]|uniref:TRAP transporter small permease subunit n=1 Tax=Pararhodobacter zhoushanensis TaxID=2479545 RepID=UPI000F8E7BC5|nr:TRAP transporter small permease [Pararhodobacter zhoushanensis]